MGNDLLNMVEQSRCDGIVFGVSIRLLSNSYLNVTNQRHSQIIVIFPFVIWVIILL